MSMATDALLNLQVGGRLGKYIILSELGRGGMAVVFKAHQTDLDRIVAIKVLFGVALHQRFIERFQAEARAVAKMSHDNVIKIYEVGEQNGIYYLVMEYIEGNDLLTFLHEKKPSFPEVLDIVQQIGQGLAYCHQQGIIHRDLKPTNILMQKNKPIIIDFGLAKSVDPNLAVTLTLSGEVVGSPAYMSPEQAMGQGVGVLSDICSLGIIIYELVSFKNPYLDPRSLHQTALNAIRAEPVSLRSLCPWLDADFAAIAGKCIYKEAVDRYQSLDLLLEDISAYKHGLPIKAKPPSILNLTWRFVKANPILYVGGGILLLISALVFFFLNLQEENKQAPWGWVQEENFNSKDTSILFTSFERQNNIWIPSHNWQIVHERLEGLSTGESYALANQEVFGDVKIEFSIKGLNGANNDLNIFLFGSSPEEGIRFSLGGYGSQDAKIEMGKVGKYAFNAVPVPLRSGKVYKVTVEKEDNDLRLLIDDKQVAHRFCTLPVKVERNSRFGFFTWNSNVALDDIRIYKKAVALAASPTVVADAYLELGFIQNSIQAYRHVIEAYPKKSVKQVAYLKLGKCYMLQKNYSQAINHLTNALSHSKDPRLIPDALFQLGQCYFGLGKNNLAFDKLKLLPLAYPESEFNAALVDNRVESIYQCLNDGGSAEACANKMAEEFHFLIEYEDALRPIFGNYYAQLLEIFRRLGFTPPLQQSLNLLSYYKDNADVHTALRFLQARYFLGSQDFKKASQVVQELGIENLSPVNASALCLLQGDLAFLSDDYRLAANKYDQLFNRFADINGTHYQAIIHNQALAKIADFGINIETKKLSSGDASSRNEFLKMTYLNGKNGEAIITPRSAENTLATLEDVLVEYLKLDQAGKSRHAITYLSQNLKNFPENTFEYRYLEKLLNK